MHSWQSSNVNHGMWFKRKTNKPFLPKSFGQYLLRPVSLDEWQAFRAFYLRMLKEQPTCSPESYEDVKEWPPEQWKALIERSLSDPGSLLLAIIHKPSSVFAGMCYLQGRGESKRSHETEVHVSVMSGEHQNTMLLETCWQEVFEYLSGTTNVKKIKAAVHTNDRMSLMAYNALGFRRYGYDDSYYQIGKKYLDTVLMVKSL